MSLSGDMKRVIRTCSNRQYLNVFGGCRSQANEQEKESLASAIEKFKKDGGTITVLKPKEGKPALKMKARTGNPQRPGSRWTRANVPRGERS